MCALEYSTTPSLPDSIGPSPLTGMIEWAATPGAIGRVTSVFTKRFLGDMLSIAVTEPTSAATKAVGSPLTREAVKVVNLTGKLTKLAIRRRMKSRDTR